MNQKIIEFFNFLYLNPKQKITEKLAFEQFNLTIFELNLLEKQRIIQKKTIYGTNKYQLDIITTSLNSFLSIIDMIIQNEHPKII